MLLEARIIDNTQLQAALGHQRRWGGRLGQALVDLKMATEEQIISTLTEKLGFPRVLVDQADFGPALELALRLVPHEFAERNQLLPYAADTNNLWVAMADPTNVGVVDELAFRTGRRVKIGLAGDREIARAIRRLYVGDRRGVEAIALEEQDDGPVEMVGPLDPGYTQGLDDFFAKTAAAATPAPPQVPPPGTPPSSPALVTPPAGGPPPPLPPRPEAGPASGPEARLAEAVRGLRLQDETAAAAPLLTPGSVPVIEVITEPEAAFGPRLEAMLDGLDRVAQDEQLPPEVVRLSRVASAVVRLLVRKGLVTEDELVSAFVHAESVGPRRVS